MYSAIEANKRNTVMIMAVFLLIIGVIGFLTGMICEDYSVTVIILIIATIYAVTEYFAASRMAIAVSGGRQIQKQDNPLLWNVVENLSIAEGLPMPKVYIIDDPAPNAFATGRDPKHSYVAATTGLLQIMDKRELTGVMAHEMSHVKNYDIRVDMIVYGLVSAIGLLADMFMRMTIFGRHDDDDDGGGSANIFLIVFSLIVAIVAPLVAGLVKLAVSRQREYLADASGALMTRDPEGLASALAKLEQNARPMRRQNSATAHMYIANPLKKSFSGSLFSTHPPIEDRIARLMGMRGKM